MGKEVAARAIHEVSGRRGPFVAINCAALPVELAEAELFGVEAGAFTGATGSRKGAFTRADGGTLFLDEVGELPPPVQAKLLRVTEDRRVSPLGATKATTVDVRLVAATHVDIFRSGFREDLIARLTDWTLHIPALRARRADILPLWRHFLAEEGRDPDLVTSELERALLLHHWPMNVRELRKASSRACLLTPEGAPIEASVLSTTAMKRAPAGEPATDPPRGPAPTRADQRTSPPTRDELARALLEAGGNVSAAASAEGWNRTQTYRWLKQHGLRPRDFRGPSGDE